MRLVIEDDDGAAWYVMEDLGSCNLESNEGLVELATTLQSTINAIKEEQHNSEEVDYPEGVNIDLDLSQLEEVDEVDGADLIDKVNQLYEEEQTENTNT